jgi:hypothetical protein
MIERIHARESQLPVTQCRDTALSPKCRQGLLRLIPLDGFAYEFHYAR